LANVDCVNKTDPVVSYKRDAWSCSSSSFIGVLP
jgi:hypothetical protein